MSVFMLNEDLIKHLLKISIEAGNAILEIYDSNFSFDMKGDESPITKADIISHEIISKSLRKITPKIPVLSEESSNIQFNKRSKVFLQIQRFLIVLMCLDFSSKYDSERL